MFAYDLDDPAFGPDYIADDVIEMLRTNVQARQILHDELTQLEEDVRVLRNEVLRNAKQNCPLPVNLRRLIWNAQKIFSCKPHKAGPTGETVQISVIFVQSACLKTVSQKCVSYQPSQKCSLSHSNGLYFTTA